MKQLTTLIFLLFVFFVTTSSTFSQYTGTGSNPKTTKVKPYTKNDGTYIKEHRRTETNSYNLDNYKAKNNYNPYTGKTGTTTYKSPYNYLNNSSYKNSTPKLNSNNSFKSYKPKRLKLK